MSFNLKIVECACCFKPDDGCLMKCKYCKMPHCEACSVILFRKDGFSNFCDDCVEHAHWFADNHYQDYVDKCEMKAEAPKRFYSWMEEPSQLDLKIIHEEHMRLYPSEQ